MTARSRTRRPRHVQEARPVIQPPEKFAHLQGEALFRALTTDTEEWDSERCAAESGRSRSRFSTLVSNYYAVADGRRPADDKTFIKPFAYRGASPVWRAGDARAWFMQHGMMRRDGVFRPFKPGGRARGAVDVVPRRRRPTEMQNHAPAVLGRYRELVTPGAGATSGAMTPRDARTQLAREFAISERQVIRRLQAARDLEAARGAEASGRNVSPPG
jgi:hypothetical protein